MTDVQYRKALKDHAEALWALYTATLAVDTSLAEQVKVQADAAFDLHYEFCRIGTRHEMDKIRVQQEELAHVQSLMTRRL